MEELILRSSAQSAEMTEALETLLVAIFGPGSVMVVGIIMTFLPFIITVLPIFIILFVFYRFEGFFYINKFSKRRNILIKNI